MDSRIVWLLKTIDVFAPCSANTPEYDTLVRAQESSKDILNGVNRAVQECENRQRLEVLKRRLDKRPVENSAHPVIVEYKVGDWPSLESR